MSSSDKFLTLLEFLQSLLSYSYLVCPRVKFMPSTATRFQLAREKISRFIVYRLISSTTLPQTRWLSRGLNTRPSDFQSDAITLRCQVMLPYRKEGAKRLITLVTGSAHRSIRLRSKKSSYDRLVMTTKVIQRGVSSWGARTHDHWLKRPALCRGRLSAVARFFHYIPRGRGTRTNSGD